MNMLKCQMHSVNAVRDGSIQRVPLSLHWRLRLTISRRLNPELKRLIKNTWRRFTNRPFGKNHRVHTIPEMHPSPPLGLLMNGDLVRIRSIAEIRTTLDSAGRLKGCRFMPEMEQYCGTVQRVFKPLERFVNEFDYTIRQSKGMFLLEELYCQGTAGAGRCDRSCFFFWRVEWLEKVGASD